MLNQFPLDVEKNMSAETTLISSFFISVQRHKFDSNTLPRKEPQLRYLLQDGFSIRNSCCHPLYIASCFELFGR